MNQPTRKDSFLNATLLGVALLLVVQTALEGDPARGEAAAHPGAAHAAPPAVSAPR